MSQTWQSNGSRLETISKVTMHRLSACDTLENSYPFVDSAAGVQNNSRVVAGGPHIVLICGPQDDDNKKMTSNVVGYAEHLAQG